MIKLPSFKARDLIKAMVGLGFTPVRAKGFHIFYRDADGGTTVAPSRAGEDIGGGLLRNILDYVQLTLYEFSGLT